MVYNTQNDRVFGLFPSSGILGNRNTTFRKLDLCPFSRKVEKIFQLCSLERVISVTGQHLSDLHSYLIIETRVIRREISR
jgi:hypothetical protein